MSDKVLNQRGMTELHLAAYYGDLVWATNCIKGGLDVNARDNSGNTPLWWAADMGCVDGQHLEVIDALIASGADVRAIGNYGESILEAAERAGNELIVQRLRDVTSA